MLSSSSARLSPVSSRSCSMPSSARRRSTRATTPTSSASLTTATRPSSASVTSTRSSESVASSVVVAARPLMTPRTGACASPWAIALSRSSRLTDPTTRPSLGDEHSALSVALTQRHRVADGVLRLDRPRRRRHDVAGAARLVRGLFECGDHQPARFAEIRPKDGRGGLCVPSATEGRRHDGGVHEIAAATYDREHSLLHLDEEHERLRVGEVDDLVREVRDPVHVLRPSNGCEQKLLPAGARSARAPRAGG